MGREMACGWLMENRCISTLIDKISESLLLLDAKRATLEEKMIGDHLHVLAAIYGSIINQVNTLLGNRSIVPPEDILRELHDLDLRILGVLDEFLKTIAYDVNYLEQYYEYGFLTRLTYDYHFKSDLEAILGRLSCL